ncbi:hypothetical protein VNO77_14717 [Canavalia gladiata]|uniref:Uncharacterized protein n=1 Tax=Canavalia gladiata TaxID=3824 RepID=A0AAN9QQW9_CANGL
MHRKGPQLNIVHTHPTSWYTLKSDTIRSSFYSMHREHPKLHHCMASIVRAPLSENLDLGVPAKSESASNEVAWPVLNFRSAAGSLGLMLPLHGVPEAMPLSRTRGISEDNIYLTTTLLEKKCEHILHTHRPYLDSYKSRLIIHDSHSSSFVSWFIPLCGNDYDETGWSLIFEVIGWYRGSLELSFRDVTPTSRIYVQNGVQGVPRTSEFKFARILTSWSGFLLLPISYSSMSLTECITPNCYTIINPPTCTSSSTEKISFLYQRGLKLLLLPLA